MCTKQHCGLRLMLHCAAEYISCQPILPQFISAEEDAFGHYSTITPPARKSRGHETEQQLKLKVEMAAHRRAQIYTYIYMFRYSYLEPC